MDPHGPRRGYPHPHDIRGAMRTRKYRIVFAASPPAQAWSEEIDAEEVGNVHDGTLSWLNFHGQAGDVLRVRSDSVERVERVH